jgi:hypothetical protein
MFPHTLKNITEKLHILLHTYDLQSTILASSNSLEQVGLLTSYHCLQFSNITTAMAVSGIFQSLWQTVELAQL